MTIANFEYPGVRVTEATRGAIPLNRFNFRTMKLVGTALRGPVAEPTLITRSSQYHDIFGPRTDSSYLDDAIRAIFEQVQVPVYVVRVAGAGAAKATLTLTAAGPTNVLKIDAWGPGTSYNYAAGPPASGVSITYIDGVLTVYDNGVAKEVYRDVVFGNAVKSEQFVNGNSNLIRITWLNLTMNPTNVTDQTGLAGGADGAAVTSSDYIGSESASPKTGLGAFARKDLGMGFIMVPGISAAAVGNALISNAERFRNLALIDSTFGNSIAQDITERNQYAASKGHALFCAGWVEVQDIDTDVRKFVPRSPFRAAHIAASHDLPGSIANVGAGVDFRYRNVLSFEKRYMELDDIGHGELNIRGIDVARNFSAEGYGLVSFSMRTISPQVLFRFLHVRVILNVIAESIEVGLKPYVGKPVDGHGVLIREIRDSIKNLLYTFWSGDVLFGRNAEEAFLVKPNINLSELEQGIIDLEVYVKPAAVAERINVTLFRVPLNFDFQTGEVSIGDPELAAAA